MSQERLHKVLASRGVASRRACERLIADGRVTVNGVVASIGQSIDPERDEIRVEGRVIDTGGHHRYIAMHKPTGYVTSTVSEHGEPTVMDLIDVPERIYPVGRLDVDTAGLLLMTNDGAWANLVIHPRYQIEKEYVTVVHGHPAPRELAALRVGVRLPTGEVTSPSQVDVLHRSETSVTLRIVVHEGKKRQIRLMMAAVGNPVLRLTRVRVGPIRLGDLAQGDWRELLTSEVEEMRVRAEIEHRAAHG